jgi:hypothetical protein
MEVGIMVVNMGTLVSTIDTLKYRGDLFKQKVTDPNREIR